MRTNIEIDDELMVEAMEAAGLKTKKATVDHALRELVARHGRLAFLELEGKFPDFPTIEELRPKDDTHGHWSS